MESAFQHTATGADAATATSADTATGTGAGLFPGGVAVSRCTVYDSKAPDGLDGGSPHMHFTCTEGYVVLEGAGTVQTLGAHGYEEIPVQPLSVVWFEPGVVHRLVNGDGDLRVLVVMGNGGLPEAGDAVFAFPRDVLEDPAQYADAARASTEHGVRNRRDLAVRGFHALRDDPSRLDAFYAAALGLVAADLDKWERLWSSGAAAAALRTGEIIRRLRDGDVSPLRDGRVFATTAAGPHLGMCGHLDVVDLDAAA